MNQTTTSRSSKKSSVSSAQEVLKISRDVESQDLWKIYGRESEAGKLLYKIYGKGSQQVKINYPKVKTRPQSEQQSTKKEEKPCPQKTVISYPPVQRPKWKKIHAVDLIPRRKNEKEIQKEIENYYSKPYIPSVKGGNRTELIKDLQTKFKSGRGALPKGAELPLPKTDDDYDDYEYEQPTEDQLRARAIEKCQRSI